MLAAAASSAWAQSDAPEYETPPTVTPDSVLTPTLLASGNHRVRDQVRTLGNWLQFEIQSDFGSYQALSIPMVTLRVHEIRTLAQAVNEFQRENRELAETLRGQLAAGADSFVGSQSSPLSASSPLAGRSEGNVVQFLDELRGGAAEGEAPTSGGQSGYQSFVPGDPILAAHKRNVASQLGLDFFSSNAKVQTFLDTVAAARGAGRQSAGTATIALPPSEEVRVAGGRVEAAARAAMTHNTINQLYRRNLQRLLSSAVDEDLANAFLSHAVLSPWHKTMLTERVAFLDGVENRGALLSAARTARSEEEALAYLHVGKMLNAYQEQSGSLRSLASAKHMVLATTRDGALLVMLPLDILYWSPETKQIFSGLEKFSREKRFQRHVVISASIITETARRGLLALGFELEERFLLRR
jgi:hypothetical protein